MNDKPRICDFCSDPHPEHLEHCFTFMTPQGNVSQGDWMSCSACHELVTARQHGALVQYALSCLKPKFPTEGWAVLESHIRQLQDLFWKNKIERNDHETETENS